MLSYMRLPSNIQQILTCISRGVQNIQNIRIVLTEHSNQIQISKAFIYHLNTYSDYCCCYIVAVALLAELVLVVLPRTSISVVIESVEGCSECIYIGSRSASVYGW